MGSVAAEDRWFSLPGVFASLGTPGYPPLAAVAAGLGAFQRSGSKAHTDSMLTLIRSMCRLGGETAPARIIPTMSALPDSEPAFADSAAAPMPPASERLVSLDAFRGLTIAGMLLVNDPGSWEAIY